MALESSGLDDGDELGGLRRGWLEKSPDMFLCSGGAWGTLSGAWQLCCGVLKVLPIGLAWFHRDKGSGMEGENKKFRLSPCLPSFQILLVHGLV